MSRKKAPPRFSSSSLLFTHKNRLSVTLLAAVTAALLLAACTTENTSVAETVDSASVTPTLTPTPKPYEDFATAAVPPANPERLAQLTKLLSLVPGSHEIPDGYGSAVYLDVKFLRSNISLASAIDPEALGLVVALPSLATGLVDAIAVAANLRTQSLVTSFQGDFAIGELIQFASGFGLKLNEDGPQIYQGHEIWDINALGTELAMAGADETMGVATSQQGATASEARALAEASLDAFDARSARLLDAPELAALIANVPSGFAAAVLSECDRLPIFGENLESSGCEAAVVAADMLNADLVVLNALVRFSDQIHAATALERAAESLENQIGSHGFEDLGVRQEGDHLRIRVIVDVSTFANVFRIIAPVG